MKTKHTQGKWNYDANSGRLYANGGELWLANIGATGQETEAQVEADGILIAAAPELLEAAQYTLDNLDAMTRGLQLKSSKANMAQIGETIKNLQSAIRKATGGVA